MNKKQCIASTLKVAYRTARQTDINKYFLIIFGSVSGCFAFFALFAIITQNIFIAYIMEYMLYIAAIIGVIGMILHIRDVMKQQKKDNPARSGGDHARARFPDMLLHDHEP